jgi:hypothetical protein
MEFGLYSDSTFQGELHNLGPYEVLNLGGQGRRVTPGQASQALVLRSNWHLAHEPLLVGGLAKTRIEGYHNGWIDEEFAALLSLSLNVRCRSGGPIRSWFDSADVYGRPDSAYHERPPLARPRYAPMLPRLTRDGVAVETAVEYLRIYFSCDAARAATILRAARQWQQAAWVADSDPGLAWLQLVAAYEVAAQLEADSVDPLEALRASHPHWAEVIGSSGHEDAPRVADEAARLFGAGRKIRAMLSRYPPDPPSIRPAYHQVDWSKLERAVRKIYGYRSAALHEGRPIPAPLLEPPMPPGDPPPELPAGAVGVGMSSWAAKDLPMYLHTFAHVVSESLRVWWRASVVADK